MVAWISGLIYSDRQLHVLLGLMIIAVFPLVVIAVGAAVWAISRRIRS